VLKSLKVNEDSRQQELALKILESCPELVAGFAKSIIPSFLFSYLWTDTGQQLH
jgi:nucleolar pre-ribosomal-associated protein 1